MDIVNKYFHSIILSDIDPRNRGRYKVHIPEIHQHIEREKGIWVYNRIHSYRNTSEHNYSDNSTEPDFKIKSFEDPPGECDTECKEKEKDLDLDPMGNYGQYFPLHPGTHVIIQFQENDFNTGEIIKIIDDKENDSMPLDIVTEDRDEFTQLIRTARYDNIFVFCENTQSQPPISVHFYTNKNKNKFIYDENGYHKYITESYYSTINRNKYRLVNGCEFETTQGTKNYHVAGDYILTVDGNLYLTVGGDIAVQTLGSCSEGNIHVKTKNNFILKTIEDTIDIISKKDINLKTETGKFTAIIQKAMFFQSVSDVFSLDTAKDITLNSAKSIYQIATKDISLQGVGGVIGIASSGIGIDSKSVLNLLGAASANLSSAAVSVYGATASFFGSVANISGGALNFGGGVTGLVAIHKGPKTVKATSGPKPGPQAAPAQPPSPLSPISVDYNQIKKIKKATKTKGYSEIDPKSKELKNVPSKQSKDEVEF